MNYSLQNDRFERSINENRSVIPILTVWLSHVDSGTNLINGIIMSLYNYLAIYVAGFIVMFALLVRGDRVHGLEFDLADTLIAPESPLPFLCGLPALAYQSAPRWSPRCTLGSQWPPGCASYVSQPVRHPSQP